MSDTRNTLMGIALIVGVIQSGITAYTMDRKVEAAPRAAYTVAEYPTPVPSVVESEVTYSEPVAVARDVGEDVSDYHVTSGYGMRMHPITGQRTMHAGVDVKLPVGSILRSPEWSKVVDVGFDGRGGRSLTLRHTDGSTTTLRHLSLIFVREGQHVGQGQPVATSGATGMVTGAHLHLEHTQGGESVDPSHLIPRVLTAPEAMR